MARLPDQLIDRIRAESLDTTLRYAHVSIGKLKEIRRATHPAAKLKNRNEAEIGGIYKAGLLSMTNSKMVIIMPCNTKHCIE